MPTDLIHTDVLRETVIEAGKNAGLLSVGVCTAEPFMETKHVLEERKAQGLHSTMQFTYRNPQRSTTPTWHMADAKSIVVGALDFAQSVELETQTKRYQTSDNGDHKARGKVGAYVRDDHYGKLRDALEAMAQVLRQAGFGAFLSFDENSLVDRAAAYRAGLGWQGKSANLLLPGVGSMAVLGSIITDAPLCEADPEPMDDGCGTCQKCLDGCPTGAIIAPGVLDARKCLAWMVQSEGVFPRQYRATLGDRIYGCDDCSDVCPPNQVRLRSRKSPMDAISAQAATVSPLDILNATDNELLERHGRWYIPKREPKYLRRNALVVLGNVGDPSQTEVRDVVEGLLSDDDPLIVAHAIWCAKRLGIPIAQVAHAQVAHADDPLVVEELETEVEPRSDLLVAV